MPRKKAVQELPTLPGKTFDQIKRQALAILKLHPGIELSRFAVKMGLPLAARSKKNTDIRLLEEAQDVLKALQTEAVLKLQDGVRPHVGIRVFALEQRDDEEVSA